jgi:hypothetical protein
MADITVVENVVDRWQRASQTQRDFLMNRRLYPNDSQTCKGMGINHATPIQWRKRDENFIELERDFNLQPIETTLMYLQDLFPISLATLHKAMIDKDFKGHQVEAAKAVNRLMIDLYEQMKQSQRKQEKREVSFKKGYDTNTTADRTPLLTTPNTGDSPPVEGQVESP